MPMEPPVNVEVHQNLDTFWWIEGDSLLCSVSKKNCVSPTHEQGMEQIEQLNRITGGKKMCLLADVTYARVSGTKGDRELAAREMTKLVKAMAIVSNSALGKMVVNLFFNLKPPPYPAKMFNSEQEAREWLKQYL